MHPNSEAQRNVFLHFGRIVTWKSLLGNRAKEEAREEYGLCKHVVSSKGTQHNNLWNVLHLHLHRRISHVERRCWSNLLWVYCWRKLCFTWKIPPSSWAENLQRLSKKNTSSSSLISVLGHDLVLSLKT